MIKFTAINYFISKTMMEDHLYCNDLTLSLECKGKNTNNMEEVKWNVLDRKATANVLN
jgi:hypothetical protein